MAKSANQKLKLLYIIKILREYTDEEHAITTQELIEKLAAYDISAERKSIYSDISSLCDFGFDIILSKQKNHNGYYLASKEFELAELKFLVDVTQASKFITKSKSQSLIKKLEQFTSKYEASKLQRQVYVMDRVKASNENIFINVDCIHKAIQNNMQISFQYFEWNEKKEKRLKKNGEPYILSPWVLVWSGEHYYLLAYDEQAEIMKYYRVDKMTGMEAVNKKRIGNELMKDFNLAAFSAKTFGMFAGYEETVTLLFENQLANVAIDRFGTKVNMRIRDDAHFSMRVNVCVSNQFFGWVAGLSGAAKIIAPASVKKEYEDYLSDILQKSKMD